MRVCNKPSVRERFPTVRFGKPRRERCANESCDWFWPLFWLVYRKCSKAELKPESRPFPSYLVPPFQNEFLCKNDPFNLNQMDAFEPHAKKITTHSAYAAILDHFFQPPTAETNVYMMPLLTTWKVNLQMFKYKITQNVLSTRLFLFRAKLSESLSHLPGCARNPSLPHMLLQCNLVSAFWNAFQIWWCEKTCQTFLLDCPCSFNRYKEKQNYRFLNEDHLFYLRQSSCMCI